jgi:hypothetical protein
MSLRLVLATFATALIFFGLNGIGNAQGANFRIIGGLSNFDCWNETGEEVEGFEIEIEDCHSSDIVHTYNYSRFGAPTIIEIGQGIHTSCIVRYHSSSNTLANGAVTHFGITLRTFVPAARITYRWLPKATVTMPNPPPIEVQLPAHQSNLNLNQLRNELENPESQQRIIWVLPYRNIVNRHVELEELTNNNPIVVESEPMGRGPNNTDPEMLDPGNVWMDDDPPGTEDESGVFWFKVYEDIEGIGSDGRPTHQPGRQIATIMDASIVSNSVQIQPVGLYFGSPTLRGSQLNQTMVRLDGQATAGGATVAMLSSSPSAIPPSSVTVLDGNADVIFDIATLPVYSTTSTTITASLNGFSISNSFSIEPAVLNQVWMSFVSVRGGRTFDGRVYLLGPAPAEGVRVSLRVPRDGALEVPNTAFVKPNATMAQFKVKSNRVSRITNVRLDALYNGVVKSTTVRLLP